MKHCSHLLRNIALIFGDVTYLFYFSLHVYTFLNNLKYPRDK